MSLFNNIRVSGSGSPEVDGLYRNAGTFHGNPQWIQVGGGPGQNDVVRVGVGSWFIRHGDTKFYESLDSPSPALPWEVKTWGASPPGVLPEPTVIEVQGNSQRIDGFNSRWTPILAAGGGFQVLPSQSTTASLSGLLANGLPKGANGAWVQADDVLGYAFSGEEGLPLTSCIQTPVQAILELTNREQLEGCVLVTDGQIFVQFFTGRVGSKL